MDPLAGILRSLRMTSVVFCRLRGGSPWGLAVPELGGASFHVVMDGRCHVRHGDVETELEAGDVALFPAVAEQVIGDARGRDATTLPELLELMRQEGALSIQLGPEPVLTDVVCGAFYFDRRLWGPFLDFTPSVLKLRRGDYEESLLGAILGGVGSELSHPRAASDLVLSRLGDVLFVEMIRAALSKGLISRDSASWARALQTPELARVLEAIHAELARKWSVDDLAAVAGLSRSSFTTRFRETVGMSPLEYLTHWRMAEAAGLLEDTALTLPVVAEAVGYASEVSFTRAFKSVVGVPPGRYRDEAPKRRRPFADPAGELLKR